MKKYLLALLISLSGLCQAQSNNSVFPAQLFTASAQTGAAINLNPPLFPSSWAAGTITLTGTSLTTVTFSVMGSSNNGVSYFALPVYIATSPSTSPSTTVTATANGLYQVSLVGITNVEFVTSGTFTATNVSLSLTASPVGSVTLIPPTIVASNTVLGQSASVSFFTVYTPSVAGLYQICGGAFVTVVGSTGATLSVQSSWSNGVTGHAPGLGQAATGATTLGADTSSTTTSPCSTFMAGAGVAIQIDYTIGGAPATNPTFTYWYVLTQL